MDVLTPPYSGPSSWQTQVSTFWNVEHATSPVHLCLVEEEFIRCLKSKLVFFFFCHWGQRAHVELKKEIQSAVQCVCLWMLHRPLKLKLTDE